MDQQLFAQLTQFSNVLQEEIFPRLEPETGPVNGKMELFVACCSMIPFTRLFPGGRWNGRPSKDRVAIARAFLAKSVYGFAHTRQLLDVLKRDQALRSLCGWARAESMPHESTFSRAFAEFALTGLAKHAHDAVIANTQSNRLVGHVSHDSTAIEAREHYEDKPEDKAAKRAKAKKAKPANQKGRRRKAVKDTARRQSLAQRLAAAPRIKRQAAMTEVAPMLDGIPTACDLGAKQAGNGNTRYWRGYKLHLSVADGQIPVTAFLTSASVHDSQMAIPLMHTASKKITYLYDLGDSAYDAQAIREVSRKLGHKPIIDYHTRRKPVTQLPCREEPQPRFSPAEKDRYKERTQIERVFARLKNEFGAEFVRVRGAAKVMTHLMFSVLALTIDQTLRLSK